MGTGEFAENPAGGELRRMGGAGGEAMMAVGGGAWMLTTVPSDLTIWPMCCLTR